MLRVLGLIAAVALGGCGSGEKQATATGGSGGGTVAGPKVPACVAFETVTAGKPCVRETQSGSGVFTGTRFKYTYYESTHVTHEEADYDDGVIDQIREDQLDDAGHRIRESTDNDGDGSFNYEFRWDVDAEGKILAEKYYDPPGSTPMVDTYKYNAAGLLESKSRVWADGTMAILTTYAYDAQGRQVLMEEDVYSDGTVDTRLIFEYSADGRTRTYQRDEDGDGVAEQSTVSTLDEHGHELRSEEDSDADGKVDNISTYEWNECDNLAKYETDQGADGTVDYSGSYSWDDQAMVMTERYSGMTTTVTRHIYENGVLLREETDDGGNGSIDSMLVHIYGSECLQ